MRERIAYGIVILIMVFLFAFVFAILGKGEYAPPSPQKHGAGIQLNSESLA